MGTGQIVSLYSDRIHRVNDIDRLSVLAVGHFPAFSVCITKDFAGGVCLKWVLQIRRLFLSCGQLLLSSVQLKIASKCT